MGEKVELPCVASGYPNLASRWIKDGRPVPSDSRWSKRSTGLSMTDLQLEDSGTYICEITNSFGSAEVAGALTVLGKLQYVSRNLQYSMWFTCIYAKCEGKIIK